MEEVKVIGQMDNTIDHTFESANRVYDTNGVAPTMNTCGGGGLQPKILESRIVAMRGRNPENPTDRTSGVPTEQRLEVNVQGTSNCLTSVQKDNLVMESRVLTPKRTEYGKTIRKAYESRDIKESRHNMTELEPRNDCISNTLTTVQKDNLLLEDVCINDRGFKDKEPQISIGATPTLRAETHGNLPKVISQYRIRKLTPRECGRLMGVSDEDISKMAEVNSNTQLYKQFGNSIVVDVMCAMFQNLNINNKESSMLKKGDTIKCADAEEMISAMKKLSDTGVETDFLYEKDGEKGYWLVVQ